jgi:hypothetical protein
MSISVRYKIGDIIKIQIDNKRVVFAKILKDATIEIYNRVYSDDENINIIDKRILMYAAVFDNYIKNGKWPIIQNVKFRNENEMWAPPVRVKDILSENVYQIYWKGKLRPASPREVAGLDDQAMYKPEQLIDEIIKRLFNKRPNQSLKGRM